MSRSLIFGFLSLLVSVSYARGRPSILEEPVLLSGREVFQTLIIDTPFKTAGKWGEEQLCANSSFVYGIEVKYQGPGHVDETAVNGIKLYCATRDGENTGYVTSVVGKHGKEYGIQACSHGFITGFRTKLVPYQGVFVDDVAIVDLEMECRYGMEFFPALPFSPLVIKPTPFKFAEAEWSSFDSCTEDTAVCGVKTRVERAHVGDDTGLNDIILLCCKVNDLF